MKETYRNLAILLGVIAAILTVLAVASFEGYIPASYVDNVSPSELGTFAALAVVAAVAFAEMEKRA